MSTLLHITTVPLSLRFLWGQLSHMREAGHTLHVVSSPGPLLDALVAREGVRVHAVPMARAITPAADLVALGRLVALFRALRPDIVHAHTPKGGLLGILAARIAGVPVRIYQLHGLPLSTAVGARRVLLGATERVAAGLSTRTLPVSASLGRRALALGLAPAHKLELLCDGSCNGVDARGRFRPSDAPDRRARARAALGLPPDGPLIGFVGRLVRDKGLVELEEAFRRVVASRPGARLVLVGEEEPGDPVPTATLAALAAHPRVHRLPFTEQMPLVYEALDVLALPTYREGLPTVLLEAGAMRVPVVASAVDGCVDVVAHGRTGRLVPARDAAALAEALGRYLDDGPLRAAHGEAARARVLERFAPERLWEALEGLYARELAAAGVAPR